ncbi:MAG: hypothetical protein AB7N24_05610 [Dehalococcoidia bacterium]
MLGIAVLVICSAALATNQNADAATAVAPDLPFHAFVPAMAADDAPSVATETGSVAAEHLSQRIDGGLVVSGEVVNNTGANITSVEVALTLEHNGTAMTKETVSLVRVIPPGGVGPFQVFYAGVTDTGGTISAEVTSYETTSAPVVEATFAITGPYPFQVGPPDPKTQVIPYSTTLEQLRAQVTNTGSEALREMDTVIVAYDGQGNVAFVTTGTEPTVPFQAAGEAAVLQPGATGSFVAGIPIGLLLQIPGQVTLKGFMNATVVAQ